MTASHQRIPGSVHLALVAVQLMFASLSIAAKLALRELAPFALICARVTAATLVLVAARLLWRSRERVAARDLPELAVYALFGVTANMLLFIAGLSRTTATNAIVIGATIPVFTVGVAVALRKEAATLAKVLGLGGGLHRRHGHRRRRALRGRRRAPGRQPAHRG